MLEDKGDAWVWAWVIQVVERQVRHNWSNKSSDAKKKQDSEQRIHTAANRTRKAKARYHNKNWKALLQTSPGSRRDRWKIRQRRREITKEQTTYKIRIS